MAAFGLKLGVYPEDVLACLHAIDLRRPIKWSEDRLEHFRATTHARESVHNFRIAATADGQIVAMTNVYATDLGAYNCPFGSAQLSSVVFTGPYRVEDATVERRVVVTNKTPIGAYRGYGQPEVNFARERLIDRLARRLGADPLELRRQNMLDPRTYPGSTHRGRATTAAITSSACRWPPTPSTTTLCGAPAADGPTAGWSASASRPSSNGPATRAAGSWRTASPTSARTRASP